MKKINAIVLLVFSGVFLFSAQNTEAQKTPAAADNLSAFSRNLSNFSGKAKDDNILLSWGTLSENDNEYFIIQRSKECVNWEDITVVRGTGGSLWPVSYVYADTTIGTGIYYYRLKMINGAHVEYSNMVAVNSMLQDAENNQFQIYPNPTRNVIWVKTIHANNNVSELSIYNAKGEQVYTSKMREAIQRIDMSDYKNGFYYINIGSQVYKIYKE